MLKPDLSQPLDLRGAFCPMAFVKTKVHLDKLSPGDVTTILFEDTPPNEPLVRSIQSLGHKVLEVTSVEAELEPPKAGNSEASPTNGSTQLTLLKIEVNS
ncbi:sulfurtransferase TusA family protein [Kordiimonas sp.]|uniref:sulfurtransferase TusA family protein n=1 Tax=Kordiimonas sp. TaxID=1970157 RepID=UPI003A91B669